MHIEKEDYAWGIYIADHPPRSESPYFRHSKIIAKKILATIDNFYGSDEIQFHHGGSIWLFDGSNWFMCKNLAGIEWSAQFCCDPVKVEKLRQNAEQIYKGFPLTEPELQKLGYNDTDILHTHITDAESVGRFVDSIFNACVPLPAARHEYILPKGAGVHHFPTPITDIDLVKEDNFVLWTIDPKSKLPIAVTPVAPKGSNIAETRLLWAPYGTQMHKYYVDAQKANKYIQFKSQTPISQDAFREQGLEDGS